jgi:cytochrome c553
MLSSRMCPTHSAYGRGTYDGPHLAWCGRSQKVYIGVHWLHPKFMSNWIKFLPLALLFALAAAAQTPQSAPNGLPAWAYNIPDKVQPPSSEAAGPIHLPGSTKEYSAAEIASGSNPPDWFPDEHGRAPRIVKDETGAIKNACGTCHLMSGQGHPESADIAGLPADYIARQMRYFKSGARKDDNRMGPIAKVTSDEDTRAFLI